MRLTDREKAILLASHFRGRGPVAALRKETGVRDHTIRYYLNRFREEKIVRPGVLIDLYALGYTEYEVYFSLAAEEERHKEELLKVLAASPQVAWFAELGGSYQYVMTLCVPAVSDVAAFLDKLAKRFGNIFFEKSLAVIVSFSLFRKTYLCPQNKTSDALTFGEGKKRVEIDQVDRKILAALFQGHGGSNQEIARAAGIPRTTVEFRLHRLEQNKVILGHIYYINARKVGMLTYKLLLYIKGIQEGFKKELYEFSLQHHNVVNFIHCIGSWDYELTIEVEKPREAVDVVQQVCAKFGRFINNSQLIPVIEQMTSANLMKA